jgi:hypothetical protein
MREERIPSLYELYQGLEVCAHCDQSIKIHNPTGYCDHLYYPDMCTICKEIYSGVKSNEGRKDNHINR